MLEVSIQKLRESDPENALVKLKQEHIHVIRENLVRFFQGDLVLESIELPFFLEELKVDRKTVFEKFNFLSSSAYGLCLTEQLLEIPFSDYLIVLGMRITQASEQNENGIPPLNDEVMKASFTPFNTEVSKAVRAFEKHSERYQDCFWGKSTGTPLEKEENVKIILSNVLENKTWWNIFGHYQHGLVYEVRLPSGHGARWRKESLEFIGFVEPFDKVEKY